MYGSPKLNYVIRLSNYIRPTPRMHEATLRRLEIGRLGNGSNIPFCGSDRISPAVNMDSGTAAPLFSAHVHCGQTVTHLSCC